MDDLHLISIKEKNHIVTHSYLSGAPLLQKKDSAVVFAPLTVDDYKTAGLTPHYRIAAEETFFFSEPFLVGLHGRLGIIGYFLDNKQYILRSFYTSYSHGLWRYLPSHRYTSFGKGDHEMSLNVPIIFQKYFTKMAQKNTLQIRNPKLYLLGTAPLTGARTQTSSGTTISQDHGEKPDFSQCLDTWKRDAYLYETITYEVYPSFDDSLRYLCCRSKDNNVWIGMIEYTQSQLTPNLMHKKWIDGGALTAPAYEYISQDKGHGNAADIKEHTYIDMWEQYLKHAPIIQEYLQARSATLGIVDNRKRNAV